ncbi:MAG: sulfite exporter TauE/SafE family protein [Moraxella sp.]|nr:sulfite exporter TauE/SafE family protein [Moraxella sp.]
MNVTLLLSAVAMGFFGSPHCLGMCGGIVTAFGMSMHNANPTKKRLLIFSYHLGRLISYMLLGVVASVFGASLLSPFMHSGVPRFLLGASLVLAGLLMLGLPLLNRLERVGLGLWQKLSPLRAKLFPLDKFPKAVAAGLLWGLLPCGLVYAALLVAVSGAGFGVTDPNLVAQLQFGAVFMLFFGLGTLPMLLFAQTVVLWLQKAITRYQLRRLGGAVIVLSGLAVIVPPLLHNHDHHAHAHAHAEHQAVLDAEHGNHSHHAPHQGSHEGQAHHGAETSSHHSNDASHDNHSHHNHATHEGQATHSHHH